MLTRVVAVLVAHNRRASTLAALRHLLGQDSRIVLEVTLVDAGSTDGTADAVVEQFPDVHVLRRGAELFWNGGMRLGMAAARATDPDFVLWLNDDTDLDATALQRLMAVYDSTQAARGACIVVGAVSDPDTGTTTYGGVVRPSRLRPMHFALVPASDAVAEADTMNGNCVLLSRDVIDRVGLLDPTFTHGMGDYDYGLRARRAGIPVLLAPGTVGVCRRNPPPAASSVRAEWTRLRSPKGLPLPEWVRFCRRWAGVAWPLYAASPYVRRLLGARRPSPR